MFWLRKSEEKPENATANEDLSAEGEEVESTEMEFSRTASQEVKRPRKIEQDKVTIKLPKWITRPMAEEFTRKKLLGVTLRDMIIYIFFMIFVSIVTHSDVSPSMYNIISSVRSVFLQRQFATDNEIEIDFEGIKTASDFWHFCESTLLDQLYPENYYDDEHPVAPAPDDDRKILFNNQILGVPRIRQVKVRNDSCVIHEYFRRLFLTCFDMFDSNTEDKESFGLKTPTAWVYSTESQTKSIAKSGWISRYNGAGFYQDLKFTKNESRQIIQDLKENLWIDRGTRAVFIDFSVYNANLNLFLYNEFIFEFPPTGGVITSYDMQAFKLLRSKTDPMLIFIISSEFAVYAFTVFYLLEEIRTLTYFKFRYFLKFWSYVDMTIISFVIAKLVLVVLLEIKRGPALDEIKKHPDKYGNLEYISYLKMVHNSLQASMLFFVYVKTFKYLNFNKRMGQLNNTLKRCAKDILSFAIMFFIIFCAFAALGYLLFGSQVEGFSTFGRAMFTLLRTILGDFDYAVIERANRVLAPLYFLSYIFLVFFVLLNMFLAIINDTYVDVKTEIAIAPDEVQMTDFIMGKIYKILKKLGCNVKKWMTPKSEFSATIHQIREALKKCKFSDLEIEMFFARYNIDPLAEVTGDDIERLTAELEDQHKKAAGTQRGDEQITLVQLSDFINQQERLDEIERTIELLADKVDSLIQKLDAVENYRKSRKQ